MVERIKRVWTERRKLVVAVVLLALGSAGFAAVRLTRPSPKIPTAEVKLGEFVDYLQLRGEMKARRSIEIDAPSEAGADIQIVKLVKNGAQVKKGDLVAQFDFASLKHTLDEKRSELKQANAEIGQTRAQGRLTEEQDRTDLLKADYDVERAKLEVSKQEIVSEIEGEEAKAKLADAEQKLKETEAKLKSDQSGTDADVEAKQEKRGKAAFEVQRAERQIHAMTVPAPANGFVTIMPNWHAGGFFTENPPEYKEGDRVWPGATIAELPDISSMRMTANVDEIDRGRLSVGQTASIRVDAVPDKEFTGRVALISTLAKMDFSSWPPARNFELVVQPDQTDARLRPGMSATARVAVERFPKSVLIPVGAVFQKDGKAVAYVVHGSDYELRSVEVAHRSSEQVAVASGLKPGEHVSLKDPTQTGKQ